MNWRVVFRTFLLMLLGILVMGVGIWGLRLTIASSDRILLAGFAIFWAPVIYRIWPKRQKKAERPKAPSQPRTLPPSAHALWYELETRRPGTARLDLHACTPMCVGIWEDDCR